MELARGAHSYGLIKHPRPVAFRGRVHLRDTRPSIVIVLSSATMSLPHETTNPAFAEKESAAPYEATTPDEHKGVHHSDVDPENPPLPAEQNALHRDLKGRHMQMIAMQVEQ
jgi:hypothetical protein